MSLLEIIILVITLTIFFHQALYWVYFWQVKEYRRDRFVSGCKTDLKKIVLDQFNLRYWFRPKPTSRSLASLFLALLFLLILPGPVLLLLAPVTTALAIAVATPIFVIYKKSLAQKAALVMRNYPGVVIGITGSFGKSSTKEFLAQVLGQKFKVAKTPANVNSEIGVVQTVLKLKGDEEVFIVEMGAYKLGEIKAICDIVRPKIGIITGLGDQHLELFQTLNNLKKAKYELIEALPKDGLAMVADKDFFQSEAKDSREFFDHVEFLYDQQKFFVPVLGQDLIRNVIAVIKVSQKLGLTLPRIAAGLKNIDKNKISPRLVKLSDDIYIVDDSYNASYESFISSLNYLRLFPGFTKVVVTPGIIELGDKAKNDHQKIGQKLESVDKVFVTSPAFYQELNVAGKAELITTNLSRQLKIWKKPKTVFLFKGRVQGAIIKSLYD